MVPPFPVNVVFCAALEIHLAPFVMTTVTGFVALAPMVMDEVFVKPVQCVPSIVRSSFTFTFS